MSDMHPIPIRVDWTAAWLNPRGRLTVGPRDPGAPLTAATLRYVRAIETFLQREFAPLLRDTNAAQLRAWAPDLEVMTRGALLKVARGEIRLDVPLSEEAVHQIPVRLTDPDA